MSLITQSIDAGFMAARSAAPVRATVYHLQLGAVGTPQLQWSATSEAVTGIMARSSETVTNSDREIRWIFSIHTNDITRKPGRGDRIAIDSGHPGYGTYKVEMVRDVYGRVFQCHLAGPGLPSTLRANDFTPRWQNLVLNPGSGTFTWDGEPIDDGGGPLEVIYKLRYRKPPTFGQWSTYVGPSTLADTYSGAAGPVGLAAGTYEVAIQGRDALLTDSNGVWGDYFPMGEVVVS